MNKMWLLLSQKHNVSKNLLSGIIYNHLHGIPRQVSLNIRSEEGCAWKMNVLRLFLSNALPILGCLWSFIFIHYSRLVSYISIGVLSRHCDISSVDRNARPVAPLTEPPAKYRPRLSVRLHNPVSPNPAIYRVIFHKLHESSHNRGCLSYVSPARSGLNKISMQSDT
jgi:hypothetical protein